MWNLKHGTNEPIYKTETGLPDIENRFVIAKGGGGEGQMGSLGLADAHNYLYSSVHFSHSVVSDSL